MAAFYFQKTVIHPNYNEDNPPYPYNHDLALIETKNSMLFNRQVSPACVSALGPTPEQTCWTTGWGSYKGRRNN